MTHEVRNALLILTVVFIVALFAASIFGIHPLVFGQFPFLLVMAWGILDAAFHRDSVWREADQNKVVWVVVQFIPVLGTLGYYILVHRSLLDAEESVPHRQ